MPFALMVLFSYRGSAVDAGATPHSWARDKSHPTRVQIPLQAEPAREFNVNSKLKLQKARGGLVINREGKSHRPAPWLGRC